MASKASSLRANLKEATYQEILNAAEVELAENGVLATSMQAIAQRAKVAVGTLYNYFKDKDELLTALLTTRRVTLINDLKAAMELHGPQPFAQQLEDIVDRILRIFDSQRHYLMIMLANEAPVKVRHPGVSPHTAFIDSFRPLIAKGVASGELLDQDVDLYASALASLIRSVMIERLKDKQRSFREATPFVVRMFLHGAQGVL